MALNFKNVFHCLPLDYKNLTLNTKSHFIFLKISFDFQKIVYYLYIFISFTMFDSFYFHITYFRANSPSYMLGWLFSKYTSFGSFSIPKTSLLLSLSSLATLTKCIPLTAQSSSMRSNVSSNWSTFRESGSSIVRKFNHWLIDKLLTLIFEWSLLK